MDNVARLAVFQAQVENVRALEGARKQVSRTINAALRLGDDPMAEVHTKLYAQLFSAWAEASFLKVLHTPHGFSLNEIAQIKKIWSDSGITSGWNKCIELGLRKVPAQQSGFVPNVSQRILKLVSEYVTDPSLLRNKIAHGQWRVALNKGNTAVNPALTQKLDELDIVKIDIWFGSHRRLALIVENLIESPRRTFIGAYWPQLIELEAFVDKTKLWSISAKVASIRAKSIRAQPRPHIAS
ncbi:MAG: hypothetical protein ACK530_02290 [Alphaproteobacteria bacterium]|jgi:hypothetical protein